MNEYNYTCIKKEITKSSRSNNTLSTLFWSRIQPYHHQWHQKYSQQHVLKVIVDMLLQSNPGNKLLGYRQNTKISRCTQNWPLHAATNDHKPVVIQCWSKAGTVNCYLTVQLSTYQQINIRKAKSMPEGLPDKLKLKIGDVCIYQACNAHSNTIIILWHQLLVISS